MRTPILLGGGMAVGISVPSLVREVSMYTIPGVGPGRCLGITSGTAAANLLTRRLQHGDTTVRRALDALAARAPALDRELRELHDLYFIEGGKASDKPYRPVRNCDLQPNRALKILLVAANFTAVWECKDGHENPVGINYLHKIEMSLIPAMYGAVLAGVDFVCVGAGNPAPIPGYLRKLARHEKVEQTINVARSTQGPFRAVFDPRELVGDLPEVACPRFVAIVTTVEQASLLAKDDTTRPYGFVFEGPCAGGHNAPPADYQRIKGEPPTWGPKDELEMDRLGELEQPFWLAGCMGNPEGLRKALEVGAAGVQFGTTLALSNESGMSATLRNDLLGRIWRNELQVASEPLMSPTGFPFKVAQVPGSISEAEVREEREKHACCDLGHLLTAFETKKKVTRPDGSVEEIAEPTTICPAEPLGTFTRKGGALIRRKGSICLCNGLLSTAGFPNVRGGTYLEPPVVTLGDRSLRDVRQIQRRVKSRTYSAQQAMAYVLEGLHKVEQQGFQTRERTLTVPERVAAVR